MVCQPHAVSYASKKFNTAQRNYAVIEKEGLAVLWACRYFHTHLHGRHFTLESDHRPLQILCTSHCAHGRITRWALALQEYSFTVRIIPGAENIGADYLSRASTLQPYEGTPPAADCLPQRKDGRQAPKKPTDRPGLLSSPGEKSTAPARKVKKKN